MAMTLKPSLEGWKLGKINSINTYSIPLKPSLEGWKQLRARAEAMEAGILETFLRGMETRPILQLQSPLSKPLKPSLEGWKRELLRLLP